MNVMVVGLLAIAAYLVVMVWWLRYEERSESEGAPSPDAPRREGGR